MLGFADPAVVKAGLGVAAGVALYEGCSQLFATFERIEQTLSGLRGLESGRLRVAISPTAAYFAPALLARFAERHPGVDVALQIHNRQRA